MTSTLRRVVGFGKGTLTFVPMLFVQARILTFAVARNVLAVDRTSMGMGMGARTRTEKMERHPPRRRSEEVARCPPPFGQASRRLLSPLPPAKFSIAPVKIVRFTAGRRLFPIAPNRSHVRRHAPALRFVPVGVFWRSRGPRRRDAVFTQRAAGQERARTTHVRSGRALSTLWRRLTDQRSEPGLAGGNQIRVSNAGHRSAGLLGQPELAPDVRRNSRTNETRRQEAGVGVFHQHVQLL